MKSMKKIVSVVLALIMVMGMSSSVFATTGENGYTITINNDATGHTYEAYQIFTGDLNEAGTKLSNIEWGSGITDAGQNALEAKYGKDSAAGVAKALNDSNAVEFSKEAAKYLTTPSASTDACNDGKYVISGLSAGYYLIKDKDGSLTGVNDSYTAYILRVVSDVTTAPKSAGTTWDKAVKDTNDTTGETTKWQDSADYDIGDEVPFQLKANITSKYDDYSEFELVFHDQQSAGLTFNPDSVKVYVDETEITTGFTVVTEGLTDGCTFEVQFANLKTINEVKAGSEVIVEYTSTLNENAVVGGSGNTNAMKLEYSNNPNNTEETGVTPNTTTVVFTYKTVVNKVDENSKALTGAEFTLEKVMADESRTTIAVVKNNAGTEFTFRGLDDGNYILTETVTPDGYNTIGPIEFTISATHGPVEDGDVDQLTALTATVTKGEADFTGAVDTGSLTTTIINNPGSTLPSTGGMGTTILYIAGALLIIGAGTTLVMRRRRAEEN